MAYELRESPPTVDRFLERRDAAGMAERSREAVEQGLPSSCYAVTVVDEAGETVGMARIVGDGGACSTSPTWRCTRTTSARDWGVG